MKTLVLASLLSLSCARTATAPKPKMEYTELACASYGPMTGAREDAVEAMLPPEWRALSVAQENLRGEQFCVCAVKATRDKLENAIKVLGMPTNPLVEAYLQHSGEYLKSKGL